MDFNTRTIDLAKLNSMTKYPSIPTYHMLDPTNGNLLEEPMAFDGLVIATEKIDGTNARIILLPDGNYIIGSREELLYAKGDLIGNPALGIVDVVKGIADFASANARLFVGELGRNAIHVLYGEVYGGKVTGASKQYTSERAFGFRLFDVCSIENYDALFELDPSRIASWRDSGGQSFALDSMMRRTAYAICLETVPRLFEIDAERLPQNIADTQAFLIGSIDRTQCALDEQAGGQPEGIVIRTVDRSRIAKLRFEDYARTMKRRK